MSSFESLATELARHPQGDALARLVHALASSSFDERRTTLSEGLDEARARLSLDAAAAETTFGNVLRALEHGPNATGPERMLLSALLVRGVLLARPEGVLAEERTADVLVWIGGHTAIDPLSALDAIVAFGPGEGDAGRALASGIWRGVVRTIARFDEGAPVPRASALYAAVSLSRASNADARREAQALAPALKDPLHKSLLAAAQETESQGAISFHAEVVSPPRGPAWQLILTPVLPLVALARVFARLVLQMRRPAEVSIARDSVVVRSRTELFGRTMREWDLVIPTTGLSRAARQVRYPRLATYVGIFTLLLGSYLGFRLVFDGVRAGAPDFLGLGLGVVVVALLVDYVVGRLPTRAPKQCELLFVTKKGVAVGLGGVDRAVADTAILRLGQPS